MLSVGKVFFFAFFDICRLAKGPQDIPESKNLLKLCLIIYGLFSIGLAMFIETPGNAILAGLMDVALLMLLMQALLQIFSKSIRWSQTVTAISGTGIIISLLALPLCFIVDFSVTIEVTSSSEQIYGKLLLAILFYWNIVIIAHIFRHALEINFVVAIVLALSYIWLVSSFITVILPPETIAPTGLL